MENVTDIPEVINPDEVPVLLYDDGGEVAVEGEGEEEETGSEQEKESIHELVEKRLREKQKNKEFKDTATRIGGSKKELAAYKVVNKENLGELEKDAINAFQKVNKNTVYPKVDIAAEKENGVSSGAIFLKIKIRESISANPPNSADARKLYVSLIETLTDVLSACNTVDEIVEYLSSMFRSPRLPTFGLWDKEQSREFEHYELSIPHKGTPEYEDYWISGKALNERMVAIAKVADPTGYEWRQRASDGYKYLVGVRFLNYTYLRSKTAANDIVRQARLYEPFSKEQAARMLDFHNERVGKQIETLLKNQQRYIKADDKLLREAYSFNKRYFTYHGINTLEKVREHWVKDYQYKIEAARTKIGIVTDPVFLERDEDWSWSDKKEKGERTVSTDIEINTYLPLPYLKRKGGLEVADAIIADQNKMADAFGYRAVEFGNWVKDNEARQHVKYFAGAMLDLSEALNFDIVQVNKLGGLSVGFGSRGRGKALAHYEASRKFINITKKRGDGSIAHEWGHYFDNVSIERDEHRAEAVFFTQAVHVIEKSRKKRSRAYIARETKTDDLAKAFKKIMHFIVGEYPGDDDTSSQYYTRSSEMKSAYWIDPVELFARAWETYVYDKLQQKNLFNNYLVGGSYFDRAVYPQGEERQHLFTLYDQLIEAFKKQYEIGDFNNLGITNRVDEQVEYEEEPTSLPKNITTKIPENITVDPPVETKTETMSNTEIASKVNTDPRTTAVGAITGSKVDRVEQRGYEFISGELKNR
jgi:hypothetical protein